MVWLRKWHAFARLYVNFDASRKECTGGCYRGGKVRLKPIFMTALTMVVGMLPTALVMTQKDQKLVLVWHKI